MNRFRFAALGVCVLAIAAVPIPEEKDSSLPGVAETNLLKNLVNWEAAKADKNDAVDGLRWQLRSGHFVFGMPRLDDDRHNFKPDGYTKKQAGISVIAREGFVVAHFDRMKGPLWVAQRWTKFDHNRMGDVASQGRPWKEDLELPLYTRGGDSYDGNKTKLDRGHMARHAMNRAWGIDTSNWACKMSNSAPQHRRVNRFGSAWGKLEDEIRDIVKSTSYDIDAVWTISGTIFRDKTNPASETPEEDFDEVVRFTEGKFGIPDATYKVVGWFDDNQRFQARAYVFEQAHTAAMVGGELNITYTLGNTKDDLEKYLVKIDDLENRTGLDFFPMLRNSIEDFIERTDYSDMWGAQ